MIDLSEKYLTMLEDIILRNVRGDVEVLMFGSRVNGTARKYSDIDICLKSKHEIQPLVINRLKEEVSMSDLPYLVDIVVYSNCTWEFQRIIDSSSVRICTMDD